jgi:hypothetical protein
LYIRLHARACYGLATGRQPNAKHRRKIDLSRNRADLPFDRWCDIDESRIQRTVYGSEIGREVNQNLGTGCDAPAEATGGANAAEPPNPQQISSCAFSSMAGVSSDPISNGLASSTPKLTMILSVRQVQSHRFKFPVVYVPAQN